MILRYKELPRWNSLIEVTECVSLITVLTAARLAMLLFLPHRLVYEQFTTVTVHCTMRVTAAQIMICVFSLTVSLALSW